MPSTYEVYGPACPICGGQVPDLPGLDPKRPHCSQPCELAWRIDHGLPVQDSELGAVR